MDYGGRRFWCINKWLCSRIYSFKNTENYLVSSEDKKSLLGEESHARELGIQGVPCFIVNKEIVLFGAQDKDNFVNIFKSIVNDN